MEYPKINSLWKREGWYFEQDKKKSKDYQEGRQSFIIGDYANPEFGNIRNWLVDEKVDGTNIRIYFQKSFDGEGEPTVVFCGRTANAQLPCHLLERLQEIFTVEKLMQAFPLDPGGKVVLYGEGYGPKIQGCGSNYRKDAGFILFDVVVGHWWLQRGDVIDIAMKLGIPIVPSFGILTEPEIVELVKSKPLSKCSIVPQMIEGVVCRSEPLMLFRNQEPVKWKLKCKEFI
jgi:hypothetical protein